MQKVTFTSYSIMEFGTIYALIYSYSDFSIDYYSDSDSKFKLTNSIDSKNNKFL